MVGSAGQAYLPDQFEHCFEGQAARFSIPIGFEWRLCVCQHILLADAQKVSFTPIVLKNYAARETARKFGTSFSQAALLQLRLAKAASSAEYSVDLPLIGRTPAFSKQYAPFFRRVIAKWPSS